MCNWRDSKYTHKDVIKINEIRAQRRELSIRKECTIEDSALNYRVGSKDYMLEET